MSELWQVVDTGVGSAQENMRWDGEQLERADELTGPLLHLYEWEKPSATYGHFARPETLLNLAGVEGLGVELARRPTGGGVVFHLFDLAFSVIMPAQSRLFSLDTLQNYALINQAVLRAACAFLQKGEMELVAEEVGPRFLFCMAAPTKYDVVLEGKKVAGAAQRRTRRGFLHQGTIALVLPPSAFLEAVLPVGSPVQEAILRSSYPLLGKSASEEELREAREELSHLLTTQLTQTQLPFCAK